MCTCTHSSGSTRKRTHRQEVKHGPGGLRALNTTAGEGGLRSLHEPSTIPIPTPTHPPSTPKLDTATPTIDTIITYQCAADVHAGGPKVTAHHQHHLPAVGVGVGGAWALQVPRHRWRERRHGGRGRAGLPRHRDPPPVARAHAGHAKARHPRVGVGVSGAVTCGANQTVAWGGERDRKRRPGRTEVGPHEGDIGGQRGSTAAAATAGGQQSSRGETRGHQRVSGQGCHHRRRVRKRRRLGAVEQLGPQA
jgi:hypothetical protein